MQRVNPGVIAVRIAFAFCCGASHYLVPVALFVAAGRAGFDPEGLLRYIERVQSVPASREERVVVEKLLASDYQITSAEFIAIQREPSRLVLNPSRS